jgi:hypothetical protein
MCVRCYDPSLRISLGKAPANATIPEEASVGGSVASAVGGGGGLQNVKNKQVPMPIVCYRGQSTRCDVGGLEPNRLYHFKLRYTGVRSTSQLSSPLILMTAPNPIPETPILINLSATCVRIKWYGPVNGAFKFIAQIKAVSTSGMQSIKFINFNTHLSQCDSIPIVGLGLGLGTSKNLIGMSSDGWQTVYNGPDNIWIGLKYLEVYD